MAVEDVWKKHWQWRTDGAVRMAFRERRQGTGQWKAQGLHSSAAAAAERRGRTTQVVGCLFWHLWPTFPLPPLPAEGVSERGQRRNGGEDLGQGFKCPQCAAPRRRFARKLGDKIGTTLDGGDTPILIFTAVCLLINPNPLRLTCGLPPGGRSRVEEQRLPGRPAMVRPNTEQKLDMALDELVKSDEPHRRSRPQTAKLSRSDGPYAGDLSR
eukprot:g18212.t1